MNTTSHRIRRGAVVLGTTALAIGSLGLVAGPALADPGDAGTGTVTVHKLEQPAGNVGANDGSELTIVGATPLVAGFTACAIDDLDLSEPSDWTRLADLTATINGSGDTVVSENGSPLTTTCGSEQTTALPSGTTVFTLAADTAYVISESTPAENSLEVAQPTIITVPFPGNGAAGQPTWNYAPHIYPKNVIAGSGATKDGEIIGDQASFDVNIPIRPLAAGNLYTQLRVNDQLSSALTYTAGSVTLTSAAAADVPLELGVDYTLTAPSATAGVEVVLEFLAPGLAKLDANVGGSVLLTIEADAIASGTTANSAVITLNGEDATVSVPEPESFYSGAHLMKTAKNKGAAGTVPLAGAGFNVFPVASTATDCPATQPAIAGAVLTNEVSVATGKTPDRVLAAGTYCVYESTVPNGYKGLTGGLLFEVDQANAELTVQNTQVGADTGDLPGLPVTGAAGSVLLIAGGAVLLALGTVLLLARRRKMQADA